MAVFKIPEQFLSGFEAIFNLNDIQISEFAEALKKLPSGSSPKKIKERLTKQLQLEGIEVLSSTVISLGSLLVSQANSTTEELASDLAKSFAWNKGLEEEKIKELAKKLLLLLKSSYGIKTTFKALNLLSENERTFREARILTDLRLIFNDKIEDKDRKSVIIHRLKIAYNKEGGDPGQFFISLDNEDLINLKKQIERALEKEILIKEDYKSSIEFLDIN